MANNTIQRRVGSVRRRVKAAANGRKRLSVFRSSKHIYAQVIDDTTGVTLASASTVDRELRADVASLTKVEQAKTVGRIVAERAKAKGVTRVVFDRGGYPYHGRIKALAESSREGGLEF